MFDFDTNTSVKPGYRFAIFIGVFGFENATAGDDQIGPRFASWCVWVKVCGTRVMG